MTTRKKRRKMTPKQIAALGGRSGTGKAKARPSSVARAAALARWAAVKAKRKGAS